MQCTRRAQQALGGERLFDEVIGAAVADADQRPAAVAGQADGDVPPLGGLPGSLSMPGAMTTGPDGALYVTSEYALLKLHL